MLRRTTVLLEIREIILIYIHIFLYMPLDNYLNSKRNALKTVFLVINFKYIFYIIISMENDKLPYISVVITAYNRKEFLLNAIKSVVNQTLDKNNYEIVVVKNFTENNIDEFIEKNNIRNILMDSSIGEFLYAGVLASNGEIISFLDDDDLFSKDKLEIVYNKFKNNNNLCYYHNYNIPVNDSYNKLYISSNKSTSFNLSSITINKNILNMNNLKEIKIGQDYFMYLSALESEKIIVDSKEKLTYYMLHNSTSNSMATSEKLLKFKENLLYDYINAFTLFQNQFKNRKARRKIFNFLITYKIQVNVIRKLHNQDVKYIICITDIIKWLFVFTYWGSKKYYFFKYIKLLEFYIFSNKIIRKIEYSTH